MDGLAAFFSNPILIAASTPWILAQIIKPPLHYFLRGKWDWSLLLSTGGMPSSHTALMAGAATAAGIREGFGSPIFALALIMAAVVIYDATGVRRHAGDHAQVLNLMIDELFTGHPLAEKELKEMLGHTPREVIGGILLGISASAAVSLLI